jgi:hypothetical protein
LPEWLRQPTLESRINRLSYKQKAKRKIMNRCIDCNGLLTKEETVCQICGAEVPQPPKMNPAVLVSWTIQAMFIGSFAAMIAGLFTDIGPGFLTSLLLTCALMAVMRSLKDRPQSTVAKRR